MLSSYNMIIRPVYSILYACICFALCLSPIMHVYADEMPRNSTIKEFKPILVLNTLDIVGFDGALWFIESISIFSASVGDIYLFHRGRTPSISHIANTSTIHLVSYDIDLIEHPLPDLRIAKLLKTTEHITPIIFSWNYVLQKLGSTNNVDNHHIVLSLSFQRGAIPVLTNNFKNMNEMFYQNSHIDLFLLGKNKRFTSVSDWHDLSIVAFKYNSKALQSWMNSFQETYYYYASKRKAFSMLDPRPAILEASALHKHEIKIGYFIKSEICSVATAYEIYFDIMKKNTLRDHDRRRHRYLADHQISHEHHERHHHFDTSRCGRIFTDPGAGKEHVISTSAIQMFCGSDVFNPDREDSHTCLILDQPTVWKKKFNRDPPLDMGELGSCSNEEAFNDPIKMMWKGLLRFKNTPNITTPRPFCWEDRKNIRETLAEAHISQDPLHNLQQQPLYQHPDYMLYRQSKSNITAVMMSGSEGNARKLDFNKYITISKIVYAKRHGYAHIFTTSNEYFDYYPHDVFQGVKSPAMMLPYFRGIMTKPLMMLDVMYRHLDQEWLVWTDDDVYINPGWLYLPLDVFLGDVPPHKVMVMSNYRSAFTNILFIRNNAQGRRLMMDWIAIIMSGYIQCHGYDQAALAALIAQRISGDSEFMARPLNFTCLHSDTEAGLGCDSKNDWSCDYKIERALYRAGFKTAKMNIHNGKMSSFSKGCANDVIPQFHVSTETPHRPRLQCGLCTRASEVESSGHWDGPLGGGNLPLMKNALNSYFFNHKAEFLFYEMYLKQYACLYMDDVIQPCDHHSGNDKLSLKEHEMTMMRSERHLVSLTDGYAFDLDHGKYCRLTNQNVIEHQVQRTYVKQYKDMIATITKISDQDFKRRYQRYGGGEGRIYDASSMSEDGQRQRGRGAHMYEVDNYCASCRKVPSSFPKVYMAVDCRTAEEEMLENKFKINLD